MAKEILVNSSVVLAGFVLLWLSPLQSRTGWAAPLTQKGACGHVGLRRQENMKLGCSAERGKRDRAAFSLGSTERAARAFISPGNVRQMDPSP